MLVQARALAKKKQVLTAFHVRANDVGQQQHRHVDDVRRAGGIRPLQAVHARSAEQQHAVFISAKGLHIRTKKKCFEGEGGGVHCDLNRALVVIDDSEKKVVTVSIDFL